MIHSAVDNDPVNGALTLAMTVILAVVPFLVWMFLKNKKSLLEDEDFKPRF